MKELENFSTRLTKETKYKFMDIIDKEGHKIQTIVEKIFKQWIEEQENRSKN